MAPKLVKLTKDEETLAGRWIERLGDENLGVREDATRSLRNLGERVLPRIEKAIKEATDPDVRARLETIRKSLMPSWWKG